MEEPVEVKLVNTTPHPVHIIDPEYYKYPSKLKPRVKLTIKPSGIVARLEHKSYLKERIIADEVLIDITHTDYFAVRDLPSPKKGTLYLVSKMVAEALPERDDLLIISGLVRGEGGKIIGCRSLTRVGNV
jgi:hypothetical protein